MATSAPRSSAIPCYNDCRRPPDPKLALAGAFAGFGPSIPDTGFILSSPLYSIGNIPSSVTVSLCRPHPRATALIHLHSVADFPARYWSATWHTTVTAHALVVSALLWACIALPWTSGPPSRNFKVKVRIHHTRTAARDAAPARSVTIGWSEGSPSPRDRSAVEGGAGPGLSSDLELA